MADASVTPEWNDEHARWESEMRGLVRALGVKALRRAHRPRACWDDMIIDMEITSWAAWRSLRLRGFEPRAVGVWAVSNQAVQAVMGGRAFRPLQARGDRSWADSLYNRRNGVRVKSNRESWRLDGAVGDGQEDSDLMADWNAWKGTLDGDDLELVEALEAGDTAAPLKVKNLKRRKRFLANMFKEFRNG